MPNDRLPALSGKRVIVVLERAGFFIDRTVGSHFLLVHRADPRRRVTVPVHGNSDLAKGTLRSIMCRAGLTQDEFTDLL
jgi:predicted RNA binding protein YcfA (HicA-like mRNA interferase family)